jgi:hypothetical protein
MSAVRPRIAERRIPRTEIVLPSGEQGRPLSTAERARILPGEFDEFYLRRSYQLADAVGVRSLSA